MEGRTGVRVELLRWLGAQMLDRVAGDLRASQRFHGVEQVLVMQKGKDGATAVVHKVHALAHLFALAKEQSIALGKGRVLV